MVFKLLDFLQNKVLEVLILNFAFHLRDVDIAA